MLETRIARRYLWAARKQAHTAFLSLISMLGLAVGVATLLISLALLSGLQGQIKERLIASSPQILIEPAGSNTIADAPAVAAAGQRLGMREIHAVVSGIAWGANEEERRGRPMRIRSGGEAPPPVPSRSNLHTIALTRDFGAAVGLTTGDSITVIAPRTRLTPFGPTPVWRKYRVTRILAPSNEDRGGDAILVLSEAEWLFGKTGAPSSIEMYADVNRAEDIQRQLAARFPNARVKNWKECNC